MRAHLSARRIPWLMRRRDAGKKFPAIFRAALKTSPTVADRTGPGKGIRLS
jgi:hypothetical protein